MSSKLFNRRAAMNAPFNPIASVIVQVIHSNQHLFYFFSEVNAFWNLYVLTDTGRLFRRQYSNTSQPLKSAHEKSWQSYATRFLGGVKDGLLYIPSPPSADKLVLKVFPEDPNPQFHELMNVGDASERSDILASLLRSVADDAQSKHATGKPLKSQTGGALAAEETSGVGDADLMAQLDEARRQRDYYKQLLDSNSAGPTPVVLSAGKAPKKRAAERSLLNPRQKMREALATYLAKPALACRSLTIARSNNRCARTWHISPQRRRISSSVMVRFSRPNTRTAPALPQTPSGPDDSLWIEFPLASNNAAYLTQPQISKPLLAGITHVLVTAPRDPINALGKYLLNHDRCRRELEEEARQKNGAGRDAGKPLSLEEFKEMQAKFKHSAWVKATAVQDAITNLKVVGVPEEEADASRTAEGDYLPQSVQKVIDEQDKEMQRMQGVERLILPREMLEARMGRSASVVSAEPRSTTPDFQPPSNSIAPAAMGRRYSTTPLESPPEICRGSIAGRASTQVARAEYTMEIEPSDAEAIEEITASKVDLAAEGGHDVVVAPHAAVVATMVSQPSSQDFGALAASGGILLPETRGLSIVGGILATQPSHLGLALETPLPPSRMPSIMGLASDDKPPLLSRQPSVPGPATDVPLPVSRQVSDMGLAMMTPLPPSNEPSRLDLAVDTAPAALATQPSHLGLALETPLPLSHQPSTTALASEKPISPKDEPSDVPTVSKPERDASGNALNVEDGDAGNRALSHTPRLSAMATGLVHDSHGVLEHDPLEGGPHEGETLVEAPHEEVFGGMGITGGSGGYGGLSLEGVLSEGLDAEAGGADEAAADAADDKADEVALMGSDSHALGLHSEAEAEAQFAQDGDAENPDFAAAEDENVGAGDDQPEL